jgi:mannosyltransferase
MKSKKLFFYLLLFSGFIFIWQLISAHKSLWRDEAFSYFIAIQSWDEILLISAADFSPPFFYLILHIWQAVFGTSELALRSLPLLFSLLVIGLILWLRKPFFRFFKQNLDKSKDKLMLAVFYLLIFTNLVFIYFAAEARNYSSLIFLTFLSAICLYLSVNKQKIEWFLALCLINGLLLYNHNLAVLWVLAQLLGILVYCLLYKDLLSLKLAFLSYVGTGVLLLPWARVILSQSQRLQADFWITFDYLRSLKEFGGIFLVNEGIKTSREFYAAFTWVSLLLCAAGFGYLWKIAKQLRLILLLLPITMALFYFFSFLVSPVLYVRYLSFLSFYVPFLVFAALVWLKKHSLPLFMLSVSVYFFLNSLILRDFINTPSQTDYRLLQNYRNEVVYTWSALDITPCSYYVNCIYVGELNDTPRYIGAAQLDLYLKSITSEEEIKTEDFLVLHRRNLPPELVEIVESNKLSLATKDSLGSGVYISRYRRL